MEAAGVEDLRVPQLPSRGESPPTRHLPPSAMEVATRSVPCKKRPLSWYKPPSSPASPVSERSSSSSHSDEDECPAKRSPFWTSALTPEHPRVPPLLFFPPVLRATDVATVLRGAFQHTPHMQNTPPTRRQSNFSIEHILRSAGPASPATPGPGTGDSRGPPGPENGTPDTEVDTSQPPAQPPAGTEGHFDWLQCTRYRPPKLQRSRRRDGPAQRRLGRNPRIPFSPQQVSALESRFRCSHYLSSADVADLSAQLQLSETRVKIWFQNRRARERRDAEATPSSSRGPTPAVLLPSSTSAFTALGPLGQAQR